MGDVMALKPGDTVRTEAGEVGKVIHIDRLTVFVTFNAPPGETERMEAFLESQLTKLAAPDVGESRGGATGSASAPPA
jgi:preprotein translocase subunit YajC